MWFYDDRGCELYDEITRTPEYYPFRTEQALLRRSAGEIAAAAGATVLVELGSGTSEKTRLLLDAMAAGPGLGGYVPFDVAEGTCARRRQGRRRDLGIEVHAVVGDFHEHLDRIPTRAGRGCRLPGQHHRQLHARAAGRFLARWRACSSPPTRSCWPPTWSSRPTAWSPPTTTPPA